MPRHHLLTTAINGVSLLFLLAVTPVVGLTCVQCTSVVNPDCRSGSLHAEPCPRLRNYKYCVKYVGYLLDLDEVTSRHCSAEEMPNGCHYRNMSKSHTVQVCYWSCSTDGCNAAAISHISPFIVAIGSISASIYLNSFITRVL